MSTYRISHWASVLRSIPRRHYLIVQSPRDISLRYYVTHERAFRRARLAPRVEYQATSGSTWIVSDGSVSAEKECVALAKALSLPWIIKRVEWRKGLQWLPIPFKKLLMDYYHVTHRKQTTKLPWFLEGDSLSAPFPTFVIGSGAKTLPGILHVSRMSGKASYSAHIHFPALPFIHFDQVFLQRYEIIGQLAALGLMKDQKNYFRLDSTLNTITTKSLRQAKSALQNSGLIPDTFLVSSPEPATIVAVLIGGPNEDCSHNTDRMVNRIRRLLEAQNAHVLILYSQRTANNTKAALAGLQASLRLPSRLFIYDSLLGSEGCGTVSKISNADVYEGMLALADKIVVTADSVAMTNEALATGKPVYVLGGEAARGKLKVFHRYLADNRYTRTFRPGRVTVSPIKDISTSQPENDRADPLSYPGDHPPWNSSLAFQGPAECKKIADRLKILRDCRIAGRRAPPEVADATC